MKLVIAAAKGQFEEVFREHRKAVAEAATGAMQEVAPEIKTLGRREIQSAGFSRKWQNTFRTEAYPKRGRPSAEAAVIAYHIIPYSGIFARGGAIRGKPMLWIPLDSTPSRIGPKKMTPFNYEREIGDLFSLRTSRKPLLWGYMRGRPGSKPTIAKLRAGAALGRLGVRPERGRRDARGVVAVPLFFGVPSVKIRKRFDLDPVYEKARRDLARLFSAELARRG